MWPPSLDVSCPNYISSGDTSPSKLWNARKHRSSFRHFCCPEESCLQETLSAVRSRLQKRRIFLALCAKYFLFSFYQTNLQAETDYVRDHVFGQSPRIAQDGPGRLRLMNVLFSFFSPLTYLFWFSKVLFCSERKCSRARNLTCEGEVAPVSSPKLGQDDCLIS